MKMKKAKGMHLREMQVAAIMAEAEKLAKPTWGRDAAWLVKKAARLIGGRVTMVEFIEVSNSFYAWQDVKALAMMAGVEVDGRQDGYSYYGRNPAPLPAHRKLEEALKEAI